MTRKIKEKMKKIYSRKKIRKWNPIQKAKDRANLKEHSRGNPNKTWSNPNKTWGNLNKRMQVRAKANNLDDDV